MYSLHFYSSERKRREDHPTLEADVYHGDSLYIPVSENSCTAFYIVGAGGACARTMYYNGYGCAVGDLGELPC